MRRHLVFLESNLTGSGYEAIAAAHRAGHRVTFLTQDMSIYVAPGHEKLDQAWIDEMVVCDSNDPRAVVAAVRELAQPVDALIAVGEWHMICAAEASRELRLPGPAPDGVRAARDKSETRRLCNAAGVPVPRFIRVTDPADVRGQALTFPCIVKPLDDAGSNGVRLCASVEEAADHVRAVLEDTHNERGQRKIPAALIEEYVDGPEVSVEMLVHEGCSTTLAVTWKELGALPHFIETGHHVPAELGAGLDEQCVRTAAQALRAVGFDFGAAHVELRLAADGPRLIEINCRPAGDRITQLVKLSTGVSISAELVAMHLPPWSPPQPDRGSAAAIAFLPSTSGIVTSVSGTHEARRIPGVVDVSLYVEPGYCSDPQLNNTARHGHAITIAPTGKEALAHARAAVACLRVDTSDQVTAGAH
ncbi:ATP-grasp domain-containing protein [Streptomyces sp. HC307]|uniref:ATP-grasp domain-containing protein n=1 Tax=Streptomyces flavusporus TaxID=3385496 RepID=UPI0039171DD3